MTGVNDKVVLVTGAASGLGLADVELLRERGARVVMTDIDEARGAELASQLGATFLAQDVADEKRWGDVIAAVKAEHGRLDGLVNNAGIAPIADIEATTTAMWRKTLAIHLDGTFFGCQAAIKLMKESDDVGKRKRLCKIYLRLQDLPIPWSSRGLKTNAIHF